MSEPKQKKARSDDVSLDTKTYTMIDGWWEEKGSVVDVLKEYITIPNQSPDYDAEWATNGLMEQCVDLFAKWVPTQNIQGLKMQIAREKGRTPLILMEVEPFGTPVDTNTVLLYGHLDKQPPMTADWEDGLGPWKPVLRDGKLYGRGGADDGYAIFAAVTAIRALQVQGKAHSRLVILIEASEESGSCDLPFYLDHFKKEIGEVDLVVCLDSGSGNYDQFWVTSSLRGIMMGYLEVKILREAVHSGHGSGIVPSSFRIIRQLISRIEDENTGEIKVPELHREISASEYQKAKDVADVLGKELVEEFPFVEGARAVSDDMTECILNRTLRPTLMVTGADGFNPLKTAGNIVRPHTTLKLSIRIPHGIDPQAAFDTVKAVLEKDPPYGAKVSFTPAHSGPGWAAPQHPEWLAQSCVQASNTFFKKEVRYLGEGGSIPFMGLLGRKYPNAHFVVTGVLGPASNAHGPNEFLHIDFAKRVTCCVAQVLAHHHKHP